MADKNLLYIAAASAAGGILIDRLLTMSPINAATALLFILSASAGFFFREELYESVEDVTNCSWRYIQKIFSDLKGFRNQPKSSLKNSLTADRIKVYSTALAVFVSHFFLQWRHSFRYVHMGGGLIIIRTLNVLIENGFTAIARPIFQINNYTGNPFFLLPFIEMMGYSPLAVKAALFGCLAASSTLFFLSFRRLFGYRKALLGILLMFTMSEYIYFIWFDGTYTIFLASVIFYLYTRWIESGGRFSSPTIYLLGGLGGLFFYFKTTILYLLAGITVATIVSKGKDFFDPRAIAVILVFLAGAAPFFAYNILNEHHIETSITGTQKVSLSGPAELNVGESLLARYDQLGRWMRTDLYNLDNLGDANTPQQAFGYSFRADNAPGSEIKGDIDALSVITGSGYELYQFNGFHYLSSFFLLLIPIVAWKGDGRIVSLFATFFALMIFLPSTSGFRTGHMNLLVPFAVAVIVASMDTVPGKIERGKVYKASYLSGCLLMVISIVFTASILPLSADPGNRSEVPLNKWGGDQQFYREFGEKTSADRILTNSYKVDVITEYYRGVYSQYVVPSGLDYESMTSLPKVGGHPIGTPDGVSLDNLDRKNEVTLVIRKDLPCTPRENYCGARAEAMIRYFNISEKRMREVEFDGDEFLIKAAP